jgi:SAM-dependent methyltransferase
VIQVASNPGPADCHDPRHDSAIVAKPTQKSTLSLAQHFDELAPDWDRFHGRNRECHRLEAALFGAFIHPGASILELGCATGHLLAELKPSFGLGIDLSPRMVELASNNHPQLSFRVSDALHYDTEERFDYIVADNLLEYIRDVPSLFRSCRRLLKPRGRLLLTSANPLWSRVFCTAARLGVDAPAFSKRGLLGQRDILNLLRDSGFEVVREARRVLMPMMIPWISSVINLGGGLLPVVRRLCLTQFLVARPVERTAEPPDKASLGADLRYSVSVVIPCYNEAESIEDCVRRVPRMGRFTEVIVVDDGSQDDTGERVRSELNRSVDIRLIGYRPNRGKGYAVRTGFEAARGDILMILDADSTVPPEDLPRFYYPLAEGKADFVNGTRMVYPLLRGSMKPMNAIGNRFFAKVVSWLIEAPLSDTLCGSKAFFREDYQHFPTGGDPWGDFDWLFGAARRTCKIVEVPIHYAARRAGQSKMKALAHACALLRSSWEAFGRIKACLEH